LLESELSPTDLQTLLLDVSRTRAGQVRLARLLRRWREDRFVRPSGADPRALARLCARFWELLPQSFAGVALSPVTPLGTCSVLATVDQHRVVSTVRGGEVVSDLTNCLAIEASDRRSAGQPRVDLAAAHRVLRGQRFQGTGLSAHFELYGLVSTGRDTGTGRTEAHFLADHLTTWQTLLAAVAPGRSVVFSVTPFQRTPATERLLELAGEYLAGRDPSVVLRLDRDRVAGAGYYRGVALRVEIDGQEVGDGGLTDWTAALLGDAKERCLISCLAPERVLDVCGGEIG